MSSDEIRAAVDRFMAALESGADLAVLDEVCSPDVARTWQQAMRVFAFSERTFAVDKIVVEDDQAAMLWSTTGTHTGEYAGLPPTGRQVANHGSAFFTFEDGVISAVVTFVDAEALFAQLGATVEPSHQD